MDEKIAEQVGFGVLAIVVGLSGWLLPFKWNVLRLRRRWATLVSEPVNQAIPKVIGTILAVVGIGILIATFTVGTF